MAPCLNTLDEKAKPPSPLRCCLLCLYVHSIWLHAGVMFATSRACHFPHSRNTHRLGFPMANHSMKCQQPFGQREGVVVYRMFSIKGQEFPRRASTASQPFTHCTLSDCFPYNDAPADQNPGTMSKEAMQEMAEIFSHQLGLWDLSGYAASGGCPTTCVVSRCVPWLLHTRNERQSSGNRQYCQFNPGSLRYHKFMHSHI